MNITLSIHPAIVQEAREIADRNCTSPNRMIRDFLCEKVNEERERRRRGNVLFKESGYTARQIASVLSGCAEMSVVRDDGGMLLYAIEIKGRYGLQFHDACIVAAAKKAGCSEIYSGDMGDGRVCDGILVVNPFKAKTKAKRR